MNDYFRSDRGWNMKNQKNIQFQIGKDKEIDFESFFHTYSNNERSKLDKNAYNAVRHLDKSCVDEKNCDCDKYCLSFFFKKIVYTS